MIQAREQPCGLSGGNPVINPGASFNTTGTNSIQNSTSLTLNGSVTVPNFDMLSGALAGTGNLTVSGTRRNAESGFEMSVGCSRM